MVIIMDSSTGKIESARTNSTTYTDFGQFGEEVLNAGWLPRLEIHARAEMRSRQAAAPTMGDADAFMRGLYCSQE